MLENFISKKQKEILYFISNYIKLNNEKVNVANSAVCYFLNYGNYISSSFLKLKFYGIRYIPIFVINLLKNFYSFNNAYNYECTNKKNIEKKKFKNLLISNVSKKDFLNDGSYKDNYFKIKSNNYKEILFFLNSIDGFIPKKLQKNLIVFRKQNHQVKSIKFFLKNFFSFLIKNKLSFRKMFHHFNFFSEFSNKIFTHLFEIISKNKFKKIIMLYEAQPYQNNLIYELKKRNINSKTIGFYHSGLLPLHSSLIFRKGAPDKLLISGSFQKKYCEKYLGWPKKRVDNVPSFRYLRNSLSLNKDKIYLPYSISRTNIILNSLKIYFKQAPNRSLPYYLIQNHPATKNSRKHLYLIKKIKKILQEYKKKFNRGSKKISIFIGSTSSIILALEQKKQVIHITEDPIFDSFNIKMWNNLDVKKIDEFIFKYKLKQKKNILNFNKDKKKKIINNYIN